MKTEINALSYATAEQISAASERERPVGAPTRRNDLRRISYWGIKRAREFYDIAFRLSHSGKYNLVLHKHLGDVVYAIGAKVQFEKQYGTSLRLLVRPQHEFLMEMFHVTDYALLDINGLVKDDKTLLLIYYGTTDLTPQQVDRLENELFQAIFPCVPIEGVPFVCENPTNNFFFYERFLARRWADNMGIEREIAFPLPVEIPKLSKAAEATLLTIAPLDKLVLLAPEAVTAPELTKEFWDIIAQKVHAHGYRIIVNSNRIAIRYGIAAQSLSLTLTDVVSLGYQCAYVFALRSGLCDVLAGCGSRMYAFYPAMLAREMNSLNRVFAGAPDVREVGITDWRIDRVEWEGQDLTSELQKYVSRLQREYQRAGSRAIFARPKSKRRHHETQHWLNERAGSSSVLPKNHEVLPGEKRSGFLGIPLHRVTYSRAESGEIIKRRSRWFGAQIIDESSDGSWQSYIFGKLISSRIAWELRKKKGNSGDGG